jgi:chaperone required for assembly of F1-ATPase
MKKYIFVLSILFLSHVNMAFAAEEWGIDGEEKARLTVKVVDIACELSGNCPAKCGEGKRQLGL